MVTNGEGVSIGWTVITEDGVFIRNGGAVTTGEDVN